MKFIYSCGDRPLLGYTVKRGIGKGGFGEVYFALSDGGKEVALKLVRANSEIELRGVGQCLNLKHTNLVHLYDLRQDESGNPWLVMEYVEGESLASILSRHAEGVDRALAVQWFDGLAAGVQHLHDHGVVHRDLKPGNIFVEKGVVKVGDYGLCKVLGSQRAGQTQSVGTVHYMAPEISTGNYNRQIDVYSAGVILYEMLTGKVPFDGETAGEILMKHLTSLPDLSKVPGDLAPILDRALCKNPARRFATMNEMAKKVQETSAPAASAPVAMLTPPRVEPSVIALQPSIESTSTTLPGVTGSLLYAALLTGLLSLIWVTAWGDGDWPTMTRILLLSIAGSWAVLGLSKRWTQRLDESPRRRLVLGCFGVGIGLLAMWLDGYRVSLPGSADSILRPYEAAENSGRHSFFGALYPDNESLPVVAGYLGYYGLMFLALRWWKLADVRRPQKFGLAGAVATAFWAYVLLFLLPSAAERQSAFVALTSAAIVVQLASPWEKAAPARVKRLRLKWA